MTKVFPQNSAMSDAERREKVFRGDVIVFRQVNSMRQLCSLAAEIACDYFGVDDPTKFHELVDAETYLSVVGQAQKFFTGNSEAKHLFQNALLECGVDKNSTYWDWFPLRIQPPIKFKSHVGRETTGLPIHRDVWFANIFEQNNWWAPIFDIEPERALTIFPSYWTKKIRNTSEGFNLQEWRELRKKVTESGGKLKELQDAHPGIEVTDKIDFDDAIHLILQPGDIVCWSAAHLHGGLPNKSRSARFSTEVRTVNIQDTGNGSGAPNIDARGGGDAYCDFFAMKDGTSLICKKKELDI